MRAHKIELHPPVSWQELVRTPYLSNVDAAQELERCVGSLRQAGMADAALRAEASFRVRQWSVEPVLSAWARIGQRPAVSRDPEQPAQLRDYGVVLLRDNRPIGLKLRGLFPGQKCVFRGADAPIEVGGRLIPRVVVEWRQDHDSDLKEREILGADAAIRLLCLWSAMLLPAELR